MNMKVKDYLIVYNKNVIIILIVMKTNNKIRKNRNKIKTKMIKKLEIIYIIKYKFKIIKSLLRKINFFIKLEEIIMNQKIKITNRLLLKVKEEKVYSQKEMRLRIIKEIIKPIKIIKNWLEKVNKILIKLKLNNKFKILKELKEIKKKIKILK